MAHEELIERLGKVKELPRLAAELIAIVRDIPYLCGRPDCQAPGCQAIKDARAKCIEIINSK